MTTPPPLPNTTPASQYAYTPPRDDVTIRDREQLGHVLAGVDHRADDGVAVLEELRDVHDVGTLLHVQGRR